MKNRKLIPSILKVTASEDLDLLLEEDGDQTEHKSIAELLDEQEKNIAEKEEDKNN